MTVQVAIGGHVRKLTALHDTGNTLRDPVNGRPVLVAEQAAVLELLPERDAAILRENFAPEAAMARSASSRSAPGTPRTGHSTGHRGSCGQPCRPIRRPPWTIRCFIDG